MAKLQKTNFQLQFKSGLEADINTDATKYLALEGEPHYVTDSKDLYIFDGTENIFIGGETLDSRYYLQTELNSTTIGSSGASLIGYNALNSTPVQVQVYRDKTGSALYGNGGLITENSALDGTIDISQALVALKTTDDIDGEMVSATISATTSFALDSGINVISVDYNGGTPQFVKSTTPPNKTTIIPLGKVYKDDNNHLHIWQGGSSFTGFPLKVAQRVLDVGGLTRASGLVTSESSLEDLHVAITAGSLYLGINSFDQDSFDSGLHHAIASCSANNTIILDTAEGDVADLYVHGHHLNISSSTNGNDGCYHSESASWDGTNTTVIIEETTLNTGADTGHSHYQVFAYWHYDYSTTSWVEETQAGDHCAVGIDVNYWNDIDNATEFQSYVSNRYGLAWVYVEPHGNPHIVYGQGSYTLAQAVEEGPPSSLPDIVSKMGFLVAKIMFQEGDTSFYEVYYPWTTTFSATGASDHGGLAGLSDDDHPQYLLADGSRTVTGGLLIDGSTDEVQQTIQGYSTQTKCLSLWEQSDGTDVACMTNEGYIGLGKAFTNARIDIYNDTNDTNVIGIRMRGAASQTQNYIQIRNSSSTDVFKVNAGGTIVGSPEDDNEALLFEQEIGYTASSAFFRISPTLRADTPGISFTSFSMLAFIADDSEDLSGYTGGQFRTRVSSGFTGTIDVTSAIGIGSLDLPTGTVTANYGIKIQDQTAGDSNWAIFTEEGLVEFGDLVIGDHPTIRLDKDTATQNVGGANGTITAISWDRQDKIDSDWFTHDIATNNTRITVDTAGTYSIKATVGVAQGGTGRTTYMIYGKKNGTTNIIKGTGRNYSRGSAYGDASMNFITEVDLAVDDYIEILVQVDDADGVYTSNTIDGECEVIIKKLS